MKKIIPLLLLTATWSSASADIKYLSKEIEVIRSEIVRHEVVLEILKKQLIELEKQERVGKRFLIRITSDSLVFNGVVVTPEELERKVSVG